MDIIIFALWFFLPAGIANVVPILAAKIPPFSRYSAPIDGGRSLNGVRILGDHKTWRGLLSGIIAAIGIVCIQKYLWETGKLDFLAEQSLGYLDHSPFLLGFLFGFGALAGDALKSFAKRRRNIPDGQTWFPFDQLDYIVGACLALTLVVVLSPIEYVAILVTWFFAHLASSYVGYRLKMKSSPI
jgi:CDP-2,3-bis-(O-geranylgeranyl)-sn-glycerol synthase